MIGFLNSNLNSTSLDTGSHLLRAFRQGLKDTGYVEGENIAIEYRFAENQVDRLPTLAADLVHRKVAVIASAGPSAAFAVKAATATIPSLFVVAEDPVRPDLVASLARPSGNLTGINVFNSELVTKRLELLRELVPRAKQVAVLVDRTDEANAGSTLRDAEAAARAMGLRIQVFNANTKREIDVAFEAMAREKADALFVGAFPFLNGRRVQLVQLAAFHRLPATYSQREIAEVGGLMSYGANLGDAYRQLGERAQFRAFQSEPPKVLFEESQSILVPENTQSFFGIFATYSHSPTR